MYTSHSVLLNSLGKRLQWLNNNEKRSRFLKVRFEIFCELVGGYIGRMSLDDFAVPVDDELGKIPLDKITQEAALLLLQVLPERVGIVTIHVNLFEEIELSLKIGRKIVSIIKYSHVIL